MPQIFLTGLIVLFCTMVGLAAEQANPVDNFNTAGKMYENGKYQQAINEANQGIQQIRTKMAEQLKEIFPAPPSGWQAEEATVDVLPNIMMLSGISGRRMYRPSTGQGSVEIQILSQSPLHVLYSAAVMNSELAQLAGYKLQKVGAQTGLVKEEKNQTTLSMLLGTSVVNVESKHLEDNYKIALMFWERLDAAQIQNMFQF